MSAVPKKLLNLITHSVTHPGRNAFCLWKLLHFHKNIFSWVEKADAQAQSIFQMVNLTTKISLQTELV